MEDGPTRRQLSLFGTTRKRSPPPQRFAPGDRGHEDEDGPLRILVSMPQTLCMKILALVLISLGLAIVIF